MEIYTNLVSKRLHEPPSGYTERHHIVMRSMGGSDDPSNLVVLSGREHWIAHLLLHKIHKNRKTACACHMMAMRCEERGIPQIKSSRMYEHIRKEHAKYAAKLASKSQKGSGNSQFGTIWICNPNLKQNKKISKNDPIPEGWIKGRSVWNKLQSEKNRIKRKERLFASRSENAYRIYYDFLGKRTTLRDYAEQHYPFSYVSLHKLFKKYIKEYVLTQGKRKLSKKL